MEAFAVRPNEVDRLAAGPRLIVGDADDNIRC
jgi:hypothetical protein